MTKRTINHMEAGALLTEIGMKKLNAEEAEVLIKNAEYHRPAHTGTVRRIARLWYKNWQADLLAQKKEKEESKKTEALRLSNLTSEQRAAEIHYSAEYDNELKACEKTGKRRRRHLHKIRRNLEVKYSMPKNSCGMHGFEAQMQFSK